MARLAVVLGVLLLACAQDAPVGSVDSGGGGGEIPAPMLHPATFVASVNPALPPGYSIVGEVPFRWRAYVHLEGAWVPVGRAQSTAGPSAVLVIDCNDPDLLDACTIHRSAMIEVTVAEVTPGPALLCGFKSGFRFRDDFLLSTPVGTLRVAPSASAAQDPLNQGVCFP